MDGDKMSDDTKCPWCGSDWSSFDFQWECGSYKREPFPGDNRNVQVDKCRIRQLEAQVVQLESELKDVQQEIKIPPSFSVKEFVDLLKKAATHD